MTLRQRVYEKSAMPFSGCITKSEDVHVRTERKEQENKKYAISV